MPDFITAVDPRQEPDTGFVGGFTDFFKDLGSGVGNLFGTTIPNAFDSLRGSDALSYAGGGLVAGSEAATNPGRAFGEKAETFLFGSGGFQGFQDQELAPFSKYVPPKAEDLLGNVPGTDELNTQLNSALQTLQAARQQAIRRAGSGAGAPYNAAIANINSQINQLETAKGQMNDYFAGVDARTSAFFERSVNAAEQFAAPATANQLKITGAIKRQTGEFIGGIEAQMIQKLGGDNPDTRAAAAIAAAGVEEIEERIFETTEINEQQRKDYIAAAGKVATTAATYAKAKNSADLERQRLMFELNVDEQVQGLVRQRNQLAAQRAAAVSAARRAAASAFGANMPRGQHGYAFAHVQQFLYNQFRGGSEYERDQMIAAIQDPLANGNINSYKDAKNYIAGVNQQLIDAGQTPISPEDFNQYARVLWESVNVYNDATNIYNTEVAGQDYRAFEPNSLDRYNAIYDMLRGTNPIITDQEAADLASSEQYHQDYFPELMRSNTYAPPPVEGPFKSYVKGAI